MKKIYQKLAVVSSGVALGLGSLATDIPAQAATMTYDFYVSNIEGGVHDGTTGSGYFTFDSEGEEFKIGGNEVIKKVLDFEFNWLGQTYGVEALDFENDADGILFLDEVFQGLDWDYNTGLLSWDLINDEFDYIDAGAPFPLFQGYGEVTYQKQEPISDVPEPGVLVGLGLISLGALLNKKKKLSHR
ncbi:MAG: PEP-CTERM sorting domain-containing protein [Microcoleaceae cyanobacterium MO_207.B10]|nr:PEP-CTERM sorting domain-containing protein [Microcoleaceae cyanobacterium MO_207.B10]